jgi:hypothetical protein
MTVLDDTGGFPAIRIPKLKRPGWLRVPKLPPLKMSREAGQLVAQGVGVLSVLVGVSAWSVPCSFILGGLTLIAAIERQ